MTGRQLITASKQIIDTIQNHHLEDFDICYVDTLPSLETFLEFEFEISDIELPYPKYKDAWLDRPAHIYKHKFIKIDDEGNVECCDREFDTSEQIIN